jgi:hypothetical protein
MKQHSYSLFGWLVADGWCWFVLREKYCWLVAGGWFVLREKYCWLVADKPSEQGASLDTKYELNASYQKVGSTVQHMLHLNDGTPTWDPLFKCEQHMFSGSIGPTHSKGPTYYLVERVLHLSGYCNFL